MLIKFLSDFIIIDDDDDDNDTKAVVVAPVTQKNDVKIIKIH